MGKLILIFSLILSTFSFSQDSVFDDEWYEKLDSPLEYIAFPNPSQGELKIRVYRGDDEEHTLTVRNTTGEIVYTAEFGKKEDFDLSEIGKGMFFITVSNASATMNQKIVIR